MNYLPDFKDGAQLALGFLPLSFLSHFGEPAIIISLVNVAIVAALRFYDVRVRSTKRRYQIEVQARERFELERLRLELAAAKDKQPSGARRRDPPRF